MWNLFDFTTARGESLIADWIVEKRISKRDLGQLDQKLDMLALNGPALPPKLLAGPIHAHIYKLIIHGDRMLRPMLCKGPFEVEKEYTLLLGAIEADGELDADPQDAENNRTILVGDTTRRLVGDPTRRKKHERYSQRAEARTAR